MRGFPDYVGVDMPTALAVEMLNHLDDAATSLELRAWVKDLRLETQQAIAQKASVLFPGQTET